MQTPPMQTSVRRSRLLAVALAAGSLALVVAAVPVLGQGAAPAAGGQAAAAAPTEKPGKGPKASKTPETPVTLTGTVGTRTEADGGTVYTLTVGSRVYDLSAGPAWFWGDANPLKASVGKTVTIAGEQADDTTEVDVVSVDGTAIRGAGRPPWAGGWKTVGRVHPGWSQEKADRQAAKEKAGKGRPSWAGNGRPSWAGPKASDDPGDDAND